MSKPSKDLRLVTHRLATAFKEGTFESRVFASLADATEQKYALQFFHLISNEEKLHKHLIEVLKPYTTDKTEIRICPPKKSTKVIDDMLDLEKALGTKCEFRTVGVNDLEIKLSNANIGNKKYTSES